MMLLGYWLWSWVTIGSTIGFLLFAYFTKKIKIKGYSIDDLLNRINEIPKKIHRKNFVLGMCRYLVFHINIIFCFWHLM